MIGNNVKVQYNSCIDKALYTWDNTVIGDYSVVTKSLSDGEKVSRNFAINHDKFIDFIKSIR